MSLTQTMDCVVIDRISYDSIKLELEQLRQKNQDLDRDNELLRNELTLTKKLTDALDNIKFNLDKLVQAVRDQLTTDETPFDREITIWQSEYNQIKCMLAQLALLNTTDQLTTICAQVSNGDDSPAEIVLTTDQIWTTADDSGQQNENYLCADEELEESVVNSETSSQIMETKKTRTRLKSRKVKATPPPDGQKRFKCTWNNCEYGTDNRGNFQKHYRIHTGEKPYKCQYEGCVYSCSDPARFREHKLIHSTEKAYVCEWPGCTWKFKTYKLLKNHVKACHTGDKPHKCEWPGCEKQFLNKYEVRDHMRQHTGDRPFKCEYPDCGGAFARSNTLTQHIREVHYYKKQYFCDYTDCEQRFDRVGQLKDHIRDQHCRLDSVDNV